MVNIKKIIETHRVFKGVVMVSCLNKLLDSSHNGFSVHFPSAIATLKYSNQSACFVQV